MFLLPRQDSQFAVSNPTLWAQYENLRSEHSRTTVAILGNNLLACHLFFSQEDVLLISRRNNDYLYFCISESFPSVRACVSGLVFFAAFPNLLFSCRAFEVAKETTFNCRCCWAPVKSQWLFRSLLSISPVMLATSWLLRLKSPMSHSEDLCSIRGFRSFCLNILRQGVGDTPRADKIIPYLHHVWPS